MKHTTTVTTITDDLGGTGTAETIRFTHDGTSYDIDLNAQNRATFERRLNKLYAPYIAAGRPINRKPTPTPSDLDAVRTWAASNGWDIKNRGRIPVEIQAAYDEAQPDGVA